ncbi:MAG: two-component regulator propeller domain-containing protein, partial [Cellulophaga sp.]
MNINSIKIILIILVSSTFSSCKGQEKTELKEIEKSRFEIGETVFNLDDKIWKIFQDSQDNYWFGSNGKGLYHFDGKVLKLITSKDGLIDNTIRGIQEDNNGNILIETPKGVSKFNGENFTTLKVIQSENNQWKLEPNDLWFNCNGNANNVYRYNGENLYELQLPKKDIKNIFGINKNETSYNPYSVYGIDKDKKGNVWFGTVLAGAFRFDGKSFLWIGEKELSRLEDGREPGVRSILEDKNGYIWLSNFKNKYKIESNSDVEYVKLKAVELSDEIIQEKILYFNSGLTATNGDLWMTTYGGGVWNYNGKTLSNYEINNGKEDVLLISIFQDNVGTIWLGTNNDGVYKYNEEIFEKFEP